MQNNKAKTLYIANFPSSVHQVARMRALELDITLREYVKRLIVQDAELATRSAGGPGVPGAGAGEQGSVSQTEEEQGQ